ncbi:helix-turn-helix domain-containing protein [Blautia producta]|uniref:HTH-type transcriptional regulator PuuR n=1 Tax=Blautia producta TaxID=33035 RepID=A0A4P6LV87_9FIRM|nr:helix-turn-helix transcriptional regulator [Blautia producta]QBE95956.1 HTH-type transcriptional regulator PuuR [Blautia producta]
MKDDYIIKRINQLLEAKHMSQYELSRRSGITQSSLSNLMARGCIPKITTLEKICKGFGITLSQFFFEGDSYLEEYSDAQKQILCEWETLSAKEKQVALKIIRSIKELR